ncbi:MAG: hypothetical protein HYX65_00970 [Gemmatimonadetes bacterium]|nr:hypothetical protein [Gemmatimonadota bacterium]
MVPAASPPVEEGEVTEGAGAPREGSRLGRLLRRMKWVLYGVALAIYLFPPLDMTSSILPIHVRDIQWRFQATTFLGQSMLTQCMAYTAATLLALLARHRLGVSLVSLFAVLEAMILLPVTAIFLADYFQIRPAIPDDLRPRLQFVMIKTTFELLAGGTLMALLGMHMRGSTGIQMLKSERRPAEGEHQYAVPEQPE